MNVATAIRPTAGQLALAKLLADGAFANEDFHAEGLGQQWLASSPINGDRGC